MSLNLKSQEPLFDRYGDSAPVDAPIRFDAKGQPYYIRKDRCCRCGGSGIYSQFHGTCYRCAGKGIVDHLDIHQVKLYTAEQNAKLDAAKDKRAAKVAEKKAAAAAVTSQAFNTTYADLLSTIPAEWLDPATADQFSEVSAIATLRDIIGKGRHFGQVSDKQAAFAASLVTSAKARLQAQADRQAAQAQQAATSQFVGVEGEKLAVVVTCVRVASFERPSFNGRYDETVHVCTFTDATGNVIVTKTPTFEVEVGATGTLTGTVKAHTSYKDVKQTQIIRPKLVAL